MTNRPIFAAGIACLALGASSLAAAESGTVEWVSSFTSHYVTFEHGDESIIGGPIDGTQTVIASSGGPFAVGDSAVFQCLVFVKKTAEGINNESPCTLGGSSPDKIFSVSRRRAGDMNAGGQGKSELTGGTGKFAGIKGNCVYTATYLPGSRATTWNKCEWSR